MAWEVNQFTVPALQANGDISTNQYYCVKSVKGSTANRVQVCNSTGEHFIGVLQNKPNAAGEAAEVRMSGVTKVIAGETLSPGDAWGTDGSGKARVIGVGGSPATPGEFAAGFVLEGAATNEYATVTIGMMTAMTSAT